MTKKHTSATLPQKKSAFFLWALWLFFPLASSKAQSLDSLFMRDQKTIVGLVQSVSADSMIVLLDENGNQTRLSLALNQIAYAVYRDGMKQVFETSAPGGSAEAGIPGEGQYVGPQTDAEMYAQGVQDGKDSLRRRRGGKFRSLGIFSFASVVYALAFAGGLGAVLLAIPGLLLGAWVILKKPNLEKNKYLNKDYLNSQHYREGATKGIQKMKALQMLKGILLFVLSYAIVAVAIVLLVFGVFGGFP